MRWIEMSDALHDYVLDHANPRHDPATEWLATATEERFGLLSTMNVGGDQGRFLRLLVELAGATTVVEVGTFTGMSALWLARGLPADGRLICLDITDEYLATAREAWERAGVSDRIEVRIGPAADSLAAMPLGPHIDLAFVDADKTGYLGYVDLLLPRLTERAVIVVDNVLWSGQVVDRTDQSESTLALRDFNDRVAARDDVDAFMLAIGDGITVIRPRR